MRAKGQGIMKFHRVSWAGGQLPPARRASIHVARRPAPHPHLHTLHAPVTRCSCLMVSPMRPMMRPTMPLGQYITCVAPMPCCGRGRGGGGTRAGQVEEALRAGRQGAAGESN